MSRDGIIEMEFNQDLVTPKFDSKRGALAGQKLVTLQDIDVSRDLVGVKFKSRE